VHSMLAVVDQNNHPKCHQCGATMKRNYRAEHAGLAESSRSKGIFPMVDENLTGSPDVMVQDQQHRRRLMREQGLIEQDPSPGARERRREWRDRSRRFY